LKLNTVDCEAYASQSTAFSFKLIRDTSRQQLGWTLPDTVNTV